MPKLASAKKSLLNCQNSILSYLELGPIYRLYDVVGECRGSRISWDPRCPSPPYPPSVTLPKNPRLISIPDFQGQATTSEP
jgi:hypothetical protein